MISPPFSVVGGGVGVEDVICQSPLHLFCHVGDDRNAETLPVHRFDDAHDRQHQETDPDHASHHRPAASDEWDVRSDKQECDTDRNPNQFGNEQRGSVLGVPLNFWIIFFRQQRDQTENSEIGEDQKNLAVAARLRTCRRWRRRWWIRSARRRRWRRRWELKRFAHWLSL